MTCNYNFSALLQKKNIIYNSGHLTIQLAFKEISSIRNIHAFTMKKKHIILGDQLFIILNEMNRISKCCIEYIIINQSRVYNYLFPVDLEPKQIPFGAKSIGKV